MSAILLTILDREQFKHSFRLCFAIVVAELATLGATKAVSVPRLVDSTLDVTVLFRTLLLLAERSEVLEKVDSSRAIDGFSPMVSPSFEN
jgi:hypothetical protein